MAGTIGRVVAGWEGHAYKVNDLQEIQRMVEAIRRAVREEARPLRDTTADAAVTRLQQQVMELNREWERLRAFANQAPTRSRRSLE